MQTTQQPKEQVQIRRASGPVQFSDPAAAAPPAPQAPWPQSAWPQAATWHAPWPNAPAWPGEQPAFQPAIPTYGLPSPIAYGAVAIPGNPAAIPRFGTFSPGAFAAHPQHLAPPHVAPQHGAGAAGLVQRVPACDLVDEGAEYVCQLELPGVKRENIDVSLFERALLVTAHYEPEIDVGALVVGERGSTVSFRRAITLPSEVKTAGAKAALRDGVLTLTLPKTAPTAGPQRIPVA